MKDTKTYVGAAMFYDRFVDGEEAEAAAHLGRTDGCSRQGSLHYRTQVHAQQVGRASSVSRLLRAVLRLRSVHKEQK